MSAEVQVFTIGHSSHPPGSFLWLLRKHGIQALVDIRSYPGSRRHPHFSQGNLADTLKEEDIEYHWLEALGGHRRRSKDDPPSRNRGIADEAVRTCADYMASGEFRQGVAKLIEIAQNRRTSIMCAEGDYRHCHRRLLSDYLVANGISVLHVSPTGEVKSHKRTPGARIVAGMVTYPGQPTLFDMDAP